MFQRWDGGRMEVGDTEGGGINSGYVKAVKNKKTPGHHQVQSYVEDRVNSQHCPVL